MNEKKLWICFIVFVLILLVGSFFGGYFISRGRSNIEIREAKNTVSRLEGEIEILNCDLETARTEIATLRGIQSEDRATIKGLAESNRNITEFVGKQGTIFNELREYSKQIGNTSGEFEAEFEGAIQSVDDIIKIIQAGED